MEITDKSIVKSAIFDRPDDANKGTLGSLLCVCGCKGMVGAAIMAGKAALRCGVGLLKIALPDCVYPIAAQSILESVYYPLAETSDGKISRYSVDFLLEQAKSSSAVLLGCGLSVCEDTEIIVNSFLEKCEKPMVLDADALNIISKNPDALKNLKAPAIITPHPREMSRLSGLGIAEINSRREKTAADFAEKYGVVTVLKGKGTVIAEKGGRALMNPTGNSGMATGGSGDVLAGMTASLLAQGAKAFEAACAAAYLHGLAGDIAAEKLGKISMLPTDIIKCIPKAYNECGIT